MTFVDILTETEINKGFSEGKGFQNSDPWLLSPLETVFETY